MDARTTEWRASRIGVAGVAGSVHQLAVDHSESRAALLDALRRTGAFDIRMTRLATGDYLIDNAVLIERKSVGDLAASLVDGRLFRQVARLAHSCYRSLLLIEGPASTSSPDVHPHSLEGALASIAGMWRVPVLHSADAEQSARMLRFMADQVHGPHEPVLHRFDRKPKRLTSRRLFLLQALPGSVPRLRTGFSAASLQFNEFSPSMPSPWRKYEALEQRRRRVSGNSLAIRLRSTLERTR